MKLRQEPTLLLIFVSLIMVVPTLACFLECNDAFNKRLQELQGQPPVADPAAILQLRCDAMTTHLDCLKGIYTTCDERYKQIVNHTVASMEHNYNMTCKKGSPGAEAAQCGIQYTSCTKNFNSTFFPAIHQFDITEACLSIDNYTSCVNSMIEVTACTQFGDHAFSSIANVKLQYATSCSGDTDARGEVMARCVNATMDCYDNFNQTFFPAAGQSNMTVMCSAVSNYSTCIAELSTDVSCSDYTRQAELSTANLLQNHRTACSHDGGEKATQCLQIFKGCYENFNHTFQPAVKEMDIDKLCLSMDDYKTCISTIPTDCQNFLWQSIQNLDRMQSQYIDYCTEDNKKIFSCLPLSMCNRNLLGNLSMMNGPDAGMLCMVLETYFPCVENAVMDCHLSGDGVPRVSFRDLGMLSSRYCRSVLAAPSIKTCVNFMQCHAALDLNSMTPNQMVEGTYWCQYIQSSLECSSNLISSGQCSVTDRDDMLLNIRHLKQMARSTCIPTRSVTSSTTALPTTEKDDGFRGTDDKDKKKPDDYSSVKGKKDGESTSMVNIPNLMLVFMCCLMLHISV